MGHISRERDWQVLQDERRRMLEHVLEVCTAACRAATTNSSSFPWLTAEAELSSGITTYIRLGFKRLA
jgi:hypothetical protein